MARKRNPKRDEAFELFEERRGNITNRDIAKQLDVPEKTISAWKFRDKWNEKIGINSKRSTKKKCSTTTIDSTSDIRSMQRNKIINSLVELGTYSPALDVLIEIYLDAYEQYLESEKQDDKLRKELAKLLGQLGIDWKNKGLIKRSGEKGKDDSKTKQQPANKLVQFRQRMTK